MRIDKNFQLTYCTNIHPGFDWKTTFDSLKNHVPQIKQKVAPSKPFGLGLRLSNKASEELALDSNLAEFQQWLSENEVYVFTMNGFPYGNFHNERVKDDVHAPDWTAQERLTYTRRMFDQLAALLPEGNTGGISTSPVSYKYWHATEEATKTAFETGAKNMLEVATHLHKIEQETGKYLHLDIEPEPDGMLENSDEVLQFFADYLLPIGVALIGEKLGLDAEAAKKLIHRYLTVCYDICHFSLAYEEPTDTFEKLEKAGIAIGKIQVSAALKILSNPSGNDEIWEALALFDEPTYLHQVTEKVSGKVKTYNDLPIVLEHKREFEELRAHFHVPIFLERFGALNSTQDHILKVMKYLKEHPVSEHLEIETYTWDVLPSALKRDLSESIIREIDWFVDKF
ncbi:metabolite traffic protein EboE [Zobellia uliginosa]|uniref:metabolite traffic protein EboE n=1 Tax=Zobellia uliginosa TaxID=143224 RepID=UPI001C06A9E8|nr:metabolite traffic protein EboE [Zobellia uliginosa]MBU2945231.1 metabolite traffic protein EboE [Zobellia uliginosa]